MILAYGRFGVRSEVPGTRRVAKADPNRFQ